jgi:hypothetical protein
VTRQATSTDRWFPSNRYHLAVAVSLMIAAPVSGHHSEAGFDKTTIAAFEGVVTELDWRNPHVYVLVETKGADSQPVQWRVETSSTPILSRRGWTPDSLQPGDSVLVRGHPERGTDRNYALLLALQKEDGTILTAAPLSSESNARASGLSGIWKPDSATVAEFHRRVSSLPLTEKGAAARDSFDYYRESPVAQCIAHPAPWVFNSELYVNEVDVGEDVVILHSEYFGVRRTVYMDGRGHPNDAERTLQGHSIGSWEDDTLVVDTRLFADHRIGNGPGIPSGAQRHVIERLTLSEDGTRIIYDMFVEDPEYLIEPLSARVEWLYVPELQRYGYDCDPEVSSMFRLD